MYIHIRVRFSTDVGRRGSWWCQYRTQTQEHLFKCCPHWKHQQKILWAEMGKQTGRSKNRLEIRDLFADERCSQTILDFLSAPPLLGPIPPLPKLQLQWLAHDILLSALQPHPSSYINGLGSELHFCSLCQAKADSGRKRTVCIARLMAKQKPKKKKRALLPAHVGSRTGHKRIRVDPCDVETFAAEKR